MNQSIANYKYKIAFVETRTQAESIRGDTNAGVHGNNEEQYFIRNQ